MSRLLATDAFTPHPAAEGRGNRVTLDGDGPLGPTRMTLSKPVIAAVEGYAVAGVCSRSALVPRPQTKEQPWHSAVSTTSSSA